MGPGFLSDDIWNICFGIADIYAWKYEAVFRAGNHSLKFWQGSDWILRTARV